MKNPEVFIDILKENWLHARHVEIVRMLFANIYAAIIAGVLAYLGKSGLHVMPLAALLGISIFWLCVTLKQNAEFANHMKSIENIFNDGKISLGEQNEWKKYVGMPLSAKGGIWRIFRVSIIFVVFYVAVIITLVSLIIYVLVR